MVFTSISAYLDPSNWQQQQQQQNHPSLHHGISSSININMISNPLLPPPPLPPRPLPPQPHMPVPSSIRPGSMAERARMANIPMPEAGLKCPRCDSTNTKFCYFNNYNLSQPRHFCKACRRYWTRGGALRNVPVGGGCRKNKRSKPKPSSSSAVATSSGSLSTDMMTGLTPPSSSLQYHLADFGGTEQWRIPPPPFLGALEGGGSSLYRHPFEGGVEFSSLRSRLGELVKMERDGGGEQYDWGGGSSSSGNAWTDLSGAINNSSCSTTSAL